MDILIIGGGASGMMAAISCAEAHPKAVITLIERQARVGRKLLATGNGRCNLSNAQISVENYHGADPGFVRYALSQFDAPAWFLAHGLLTVAEPGGRLYPFSNSANSVLDILRFNLDRPNIQVLTGCEVRAARMSDQRFCVKTADKTLLGDCLIIACGGLAGSKLGGGMSGYQLLRSFGHHCSRLTPSLVQLLTTDSRVNALKGIRTEALVRLMRGNTLLAQSQGEVQFISSGISGPAVFEISRTAARQDTGACVVLDLLPPCTHIQLEQMLQAKAAAYPELEARELFTGILHNRLGRTLTRYADLPDCSCGALTQAQLHRAAAAVKQLVLPLCGTMGMDCAQVTAGGIETSGFDDKTMESKLCSGLFACGEVLDIDGDCGGYNLHWAWASGYLAGSHAQGRAE